MLADGNAAFTKATWPHPGLDCKEWAVRSRRYSMLVKDGKVATLNIEAPGKFEVSDAGHHAGASRGLIRALTGPIRLGCVPAGHSDSATRK